MDGGSARLEAQIVHSAQLNETLDRLMGRLSGVVRHYPPSPVVLDRFVCCDADLKKNLLDSVREFVEEDPRNPFESSVDVLTVWGQIEVAELTLVLLLDQIHSSVFPGSGYLSRELTKHAYATAVGMKWFAERNGTDLNEAFAYGLLCRIGICALAAAEPSEYARCIMNLPGTQVQLQAIERSILGTNQFLVGHEYATAYQWPEWMLEAMDHSGPPNDLRSMSFFCSHVAHKLGFDMGLATTANPILPRHLRGLDLVIEELPMMRAAILKEVEKFLRFHL